MPVECCVPYCKTKATSGFHNFPANRGQRLLWLKAIHIFHYDEDAVANSYRKVCKHHFVPSDYQTHASGLVRLKYNSLPSQHLPNPIWMEHSYVNRQRTTNPSTFKSVKKKKPKTAKNMPNPKEVVVDLDEGFVAVRGQSHEEEIQALKMTILELRAKLVLKDKTISAQNRLVRVKDKQLKLLRQKLKSSKTNKGNIMQRIREVFHGEEDMEKVMFFEMQLKNAGKKKNAHRFTPEEKTFCLAIYKQSPKTYRNTLERYFKLPSKRTLGRHSARMMFESGINNKFFEFLKAVADGMADIDKNCILVWDEMALKPHIDYSGTRDVIDGFVEMILMRRPNFTTHALVFMVRGISQNYKEPVSYFYTDGLKHFELVEMVKLVGASVLDTGLKILGSVCDQAQNNVSTISALMRSDPRTNNYGGANRGQLLTYKLRDTTVIHCFDVPHLLKGTRNNLQTKTLHHSISKRWSSSDPKSDVKKKGQLAATWNDVSDLYDHLKGSKTHLPKITPEHINPSKLKMKVSTATQVFSETYGNVMLNFSQKKPMLRDCSGTAQVLLFFNDLFDSLNGSLSTVNKLKSPVTKDSIHFKYWEYALDELSKMKFIDKKTGEASNRTKNVENWQSTIRGYCELSKICINLGMTKIALRNTNQDGLENFFSVIKTNCQNSRTPIPIHFRSAYITSILNNLTCSKSMKTNCEKDNSSSLLRNFQEIILKDTKRTKSKFSDRNESTYHEDDSDIIIFDPPTPKLNFIEKDELIYISSLIHCDMLKGIDCKSCESNLQTFSIKNCHDIIASSSLTYPSNSFFSNLHKLLCGINGLIPDLCAERPLKQTLISNVSNIILDEMGCDQHFEILKRQFINHTVHYAIMTFCNTINNLLSNKTKTLSNNLKGIQIYRVAFAFRKKKTKGKFIQDDDKKSDDEIETDNEVDN